MHPNIKKIKGKDLAAKEDKSLIPEVVIIL
jgi:hypothetical protein